MYRKLGFKHEGNFLGKSYFWNGKFWDIYHMGILVGEWEKKNTM